MTIYNIMLSIVVFGWNWVTRTEIPSPVSTKGIYNPALWKFEVLVQIFQPVKRMNLIYKLSCSGWITEEKTKQDGHALSALNTKLLLT